MGRTSHAATNVRKVRTFRSGPYLEKLFGAGGRVDEHLQRGICERIKQARKGAGLTQEDMANLLNVTVRAYQNYERDRVPFRRLGEISRLTGVEQEWLIRGDSAQNEVQAGLLRDVAAAVATLEESSGDVLGRLSEVLDRLARIEAALLHRGDSQPGRHTSSPPV